MFTNIEIKGYDPTHFLYNNAIGVQTRAVGLKFDDLSVF
jgi:hypothetical protein